MKETTNEIFSGENSKEMWNNINNLGKLHNCEDVGAVLYEICCNIQMLESKVDELIEEQQNDKR